MKKSNGAEITCIGVIGAGAMGTALAHQWAASGKQVIAWDMRPEVVEEINHRHTNTAYFPNEHLATDLLATTALEDVVASLIIVVAVPSHAVASVIKMMRPLIHPKTVMINVAKGLDPKTGRRMGELYSHLLVSLRRNITYATVSGPAMAHEIIMHRPTAMSIACPSSTTAVKLAAILSTPSLLFEPSTDVVGVEWGGVLKNIYAIACGMCDGMKMGYNTKSWLMTHAYQEMRIWMKALKAHPTTIDGLSGIGDFIVTAMSPNGRNRTLGERICTEGHCRFVSNPAFSQTVEGLWSTKILARHKRRLHLSLPLFDLVERVLYKKADPCKELLKYFQRSI